MSRCGVSASKHGREGLRSRLGEPAPCYDVAHQRDPRWGMLLGSSESLFELGSAAPDDTVARIAGVQGATITGWVPPNGVFVVGDPTALREVGALEGVAAQHVPQPEDRLAPEVEPLMHAARNSTSWDHLLTKRPLSELLRHPPASTLAGGRRRHSLFGGLSVHSAPSGEPCITLQVRFPMPLRNPPRTDESPGDSAADESAADESAADESAGDESAADESAADESAADESAADESAADEYAPAEAAAADWGRALSAACDGRCWLEPLAATDLDVHVPLDMVVSVLPWLASQRGVSWISPKAAAATHNWYGAAILQAGTHPPTDFSASNMQDPMAFPMWVAGLTGAGEVIGIGDTGLDAESCYFYDPAINMDQFTVNGEYTNAAHRKIVYMRALSFSDEYDIHGHGTHVAGTVVGSPDFSVESDETNMYKYQGMAPDGKVAFTDLGQVGAEPGTVLAPEPLNLNYYPMPYSRGARVHSDSWGTGSHVYDSMARGVDAFAWANKDFLAIVSAGNSGDADSSTSSISSPATAKNSIAVGATLAKNLNGSLKQATLIQMTARTPILSSYSEVFTLQPAAYGPSWTDALSADESSYQVVGAEPQDACSALSNRYSVYGSIVLVRRSSSCSFSTQTSNVQAAGGIGVVVGNNDNEGYFLLEGDSAGITIPTAGVPISTGQSLWTILQQGLSIQATLSVVELTDEPYEHMAGFSSNGPTPDGRLKPDVVAPGSLRSAGSGDRNGADAYERYTCGSRRMSGTSMAAPVVAGGAMLARQYLRAGFYPSGEANDEHAYEPSGALLKAILIGGAAELHGMSELQLPLERTPSYRQGFGRVQLTRSLPLAGSDPAFGLQFVDGASFGASGEVHNYCVPQGDGEVSVTLVWYDPPGELSATSALINDLDLKVQSSARGSEQFLGNGGQSADRKNTVERVRLDASAGILSIEVTAHRVVSWAWGAQPYALVVQGAVAGTLASRFNPASGRDATADDCVLTGVEIVAAPPAVGTASLATFEFRPKKGPTPAAGFMCSLADGDGGTDGLGLHPFTKCSSPKSYADLPDGSYAFQVKVAGEPATDTHIFKVDSTPPQLSFQVLAGFPSPGPSAIQFAEFTWGAVDLTPVTFSCRFLLSPRPGAPASTLRGRRGGGNSILEWEIGTWYDDCLGPVTVGGFGLGEWDFQVRGVDAANNVAAPIAHRFTVGLQAGELYVRLQDGPWGTIPANSAAYELVVLQATEGGTVVDATATAALECLLRNRVVGADEWSQATWAACDASLAYNNLPDREYWLRVRTTDPRGHGALNQLDLEFRVDTSAPSIVLTEVPGPIITTTVAKFRFDAEELATFKCRMFQLPSLSLDLLGALPVDAALTEPLAAGDSEPAWEPCATSHSAAYLGLSDPSVNVFQVKARDLVGNHSPTLEYRFLVDATRPSIRNLDPPRATSADDLVIDFDVEDVGSGLASVKCRFRDVTEYAASVWTDCSAPMTYGGLAEGMYGFTLWARDHAGSNHITPEKLIAVDRTAPELTQYPRAPGDTVLPSEVMFTWTSLDERTDAFAEVLLSAADPARAAALQTGADGSGVMFGDSGGAVPLGEWVRAPRPLWLMNLATGGYEMALRPVDLAGNLGVEGPSLSFRVDASLPPWVTLSDDVGPGAAAAAPIFLWIAAAVPAAAVVGYVAWRRLVWDPLPQDQLSPLHAGVGAPPVATA